MDLSEREQRELELRVARNVSLIAVAFSVVMGILWGALAGDVGSGLQFFLPLGLLVAGVQFLDLWWKRRRRARRRT
jgi:hypothetical protein